MVIKVLVVDDSYFMRKVISDVLNDDEEIEVIDSAKNGEEALEKIKTKKPDVITLDYVMPRMSGLATLKKIMDLYPTPVVMLSAYTREGAAVTLDCLKAGAVGFVLKPTGEVSLDIKKIKDEIIREVKIAAKVSIKKIKSLLAQKPVIRKVKPGVIISEKVVIIGSSTGGPSTLELLLSEFPSNLSAGILIVQHMPPKFTKYLAERLDRSSELNVKEAEEGDIVEAGKAFIAPGGFHMVVEKHEIDGKIKAVIGINKNPPVNDLRPSIDVTMDSVAESYGKNTIGVILTGMGNDGDHGMKTIKKVKGTTIVQDEETSLIFGMPKKVIERGNADFILPISNISKKIIQLL